MSEDTTTTTEEETVQAQEIEQPENSETQAVQVEETEETSEEEETEEESTDSPDQNESNDEILEWAKKKGLKLDDPVALAKMIRESEKKMHEATTKEANALKNSVVAVGEEAGFDETSQLLNRLKVTEFYLSNPEAKELDAQMAEIVTQKPYLADDFETVFELAKARSIAGDTVNARKSGQQEALAQVAKAQKAAPPKASATTRQTPAGITDEDIANMSAAEYMQFKKDNPDFKPF